jgi:quaternary ammonium compound-resistance protein SugE
MSAWLFLIFAGLTEVAWVVAMRYSHGFSKPFPSILCAVFVILGMLAQAQAIKIIPVGTAYAVWTGIGAAGTIIMGMYFFEESKNIFRIVCIIMVVTGIIGLKLTSE